MIAPKKNHHLDDAGTNPRDRRIEKYPTISRTVKPASTSGRAQWLAMKLARVDATTSVANAARYCGVKSLRRKKKSAMSEQMVSESYTIRPMRTRSAFSAAIAAGAP